MLKANEIKSKTFDTVRNGYDPDEVSAFLAEIAEAYAAALSANDDSEAKIFKLVEKINEYRADEDAIKDAMINAQKEASKTVNDAKAKARDMIESAKTEQVRLAEQSASECERIIREHKEKCAQLIKENTEITEKKITEIRNQLEKEKAKYESLKSEVTYFKANLVELYNKQLHLIMEIPEAEVEKPAVSSAAAPVEEPVQAEQAEEKGETESDAKDEQLEKVLNTGSFEPVIPKENFADLKFGKNN
ncbi:DivIVA domain-containing protein [Ruminococcus sp. Marseille-P6503]|uniref:DivIVA domain-containing protein n=1 Tax=Ruminococcus sp. Marseille-P6503 TaxID=2364796 RepID=UPI000F53E4CE|nr:DivIVA domain-containing protein [Ruminococcus sp. Marseille-P6503]